MTFSIEVDVCNVRNTCCGFEGVSIDSILDKKKMKCANCKEASQTQAELHVVLHSKMVENSVSRVNLMLPNKLRSEIENMLMMGSDLNLIHQIDLSALT